MIWLAKLLRRAADRLDPVPPLESYSDFVERLRIERAAIGNCEVFDEGLTAAIDRVYAPRETTFGRRLRAISGGKT